MIDETPDSNPLRPRMRFLDVLPYPHDEPRFLLRDPLQISEEALVISAAGLCLLPLLDGRHTLAEIRDELRRQTGRDVPLKLIEDLAAKFDEACFFDNERFRKRRLELERDFFSLRQRVPWHAGKSYPAEPFQLQETLNSFYMEEKGAGLPGRRTGKTPRALVAPHIDLRNGGPTYTHAYRTLAESEPPDLFLILGTGHMGLPEMFSVSTKDFATPLGVSPVDGDFLRAFREAVGPSRFREDLTHRHEHTIEFQAVFLQHLYGPEKIPVVPVLASFSYADVEASQEPGRRLLDLFAQGVRKAEMVTGKRVCLVASVDLAHIGPRYGDSFRPDQRIVQSVSEKDRRMLELVASGDLKGFHAFVRQERDARRICGFAPLYAMLELLDGQVGKLLAHDHTFVDDEGSFVSYASMIF